MGKAVAQSVRGWRSAGCLAAGRRWEEGRPLQESCRRMSCRRSSMGRSAGCLAAGLGKGSVPHRWSLGVAPVARWSARGMGAAWRSASEGRVTGERRRRGGRGTGAGRRMVSDDSWRGERRSEKQVGSFVGPTDLGSGRGNLLGQQIQVACWSTVFELHYPNIRQSVQVFCWRCSQHTDKFLICWQNINSIAQHAGYLVSCCTFPQIS